MPRRPDANEPETPPEEESRAGETKPDEERRKHPRYLPREGHVIYQKIAMFSFLGGGRSPDRAQPIVNISKSGVCFTLNENLKSGAKLRMRVYLGKEAGDINVEGKVIWMGKGTGEFHNRAGVQFVHYYGEAWNVFSNLEKYVKPRTRTLFTLKGFKGSREDFKA